MKSLARHFDLGEFGFLQECLVIGSEHLKVGAGDVVDAASPADPTAAIRSPSASPEHALLALENAEASQAEWQATSLAERADLITRYRTLLESNRELLAYLLVVETGKTITDAEKEIASAFGVIDELVSCAPDALTWSDPNLRQSVGDVRWIPVGPSLLITPWNFPFSLSNRKVVSALLAGCTVILKPSDRTPLTGLLLMELIVRAGVPRGVASSLPTRESSALVSTLLGDERIRKVSFTGSTAVGRAVVDLSRQHLPSVSLELGGNAPVIVLPDAPLETTLRHIWWGKKFNNGQSCVAPNRLFVPKSRARDFRDGLREEVNKTIIGDPFEPTSEVGPMITREAKERLEGLLDSLTHCEVIRHPHRADNGWVFHPTVVFGVESEEPICQTEIFGPILPTIIYDDDDLEEVVRMSNDTPYGLAAYVFSRDKETVRRLATKLEFAMIGINAPTVSHPSLPFGGSKASGFGRENGVEGIRSFLETQSLLEPDYSL